MSKEFDVVCLGGGVAGEAIAVGLRHSGFTLAVIERELVGGRVMRKMKADSQPDLVTMAACLGVQPTTHLDRRDIPIPRSNGRLRLGRTSYNVPGPLPWTAVH